MQLSKGNLACIVEAVIDQYADLIGLSVMLSEFGYWSQSLQITVNRQTHLAVQKAEIMSS